MVPVQNAIVLCASAAIRALIADVGKDRRNGSRVQPQGRIYQVGGECRTPHGTLRIELVRRAGWGKHPVGTGWAIISLCPALTPPKRSRKHLSKRTGAAQIGTITPWPWATPTANGPSTSTPPIPLLARCTAREP